MSKEIVNSQKAPAPIGPYNQAIKANGFLYVSGQIAINPNSGELETADIKTETTWVMKNLEAILTEAGCGFADVLKATIFISDMNNFSSINEVYGTFMPQPYPARETVEVSKLPKGVNVEISVIALCAC